jgi:hypothetical protein
MEGWRSGKIKVTSLEVSDIKVRVYGHAAVVTGIETSKAAMLGANYLGKTRLTRIFVKRGGKWECVLFQSTRIAEPKAETSAAQATNQLAGTYRLISYKRTVVATGVTTDIFGKAPQGHIVYGRDGRMMIFMVKDERLKPDLATMTDQERAELYNTMEAYSGTYDFDGKMVTHHIDISWNQVWAGTDKVRNVQFDGRRLVLTTNAEPSGRDGAIRVSVLTWEKVD